MLRDYERLSLEETEDVHDSVLAIGEMDSDVKNTVIRNGHPSGFFYMAPPEVIQAQSHCPTACVP